MSDIRFSCPNCGQHILVDQTSAGQIAECPSCRNTLTIPLTGQEQIPLPPVDRLMAEYNGLKSRRTRRAILGFSFCVTGILVAVLPPFLFVDNPTLVRIDWLISIVLQAIGIAYFAKYKGHHPAWAAAALILCFGVLIIALLKDRVEPELTRLAATLRDLGAPVEQMAKGPSGVGGWLVVFCAMITILSPIGSVVYSLMEWKQIESLRQEFLATKQPEALRVFASLKNLSVFVSIVAWLVNLYGAIVGYMIWSGNSHGKRLALQYLNVRIVTLFLLFVVAHMWFGITVVGTIFQSTIGQVSFSQGFLPNSIFYFIWLTYFTRSRRVRNTYETGATVAAKVAGC